jgi:hypothetical protein
MLSPSPQPPRKGLSRVARRCRRAARRVLGLAVLMVCLGPTDGMARPALPGQAPCDEALAHGALAQDQIEACALAHAADRSGAEARRLTVSATQRLPMPGAPDRWMASLAGDGVAIVILLDEFGELLAYSAKAGSRPLAAR